MNSIHSQIYICLSWPFSDFKILEMLRRPKPGEDDLEAMMEQFDKDKNMQMAAQVVKVIEWKG